MLKIRNFWIIAWGMYTDARDFIAALGGYRAVASRLAKKPTTVHSHMQAGTLPAAWYAALCQMARDDGIQDPPRALFSFLKLPGEAA